MSERVELSPVVVARFTNLIDAELARTTLAGAGITSVLANAYMVGVMPHLSNALGGVEVRVRAGDVEAARKILDEPDPDPAPDDEPMQPSARDAQATRAFRSAVLALFLLPVVLNAYSLWLLFTLGRAAGPLSPRGRRHVALAVVFNVLLGWMPAAVYFAQR